jgi:hypothetical protein
MPITRPCMKTAGAWGAYFGTSGTPMGISLSPRPTSCVTVVRRTVAGSPTRVSRAVPR